MEEDKITDTIIVETEKPTLVIRQSIKDLRERLAKGESPYVIIAGVLGDDALTLSEYWENSLLSQPTFPLPRDLLELYGIDEILARSLDFRAGFQLVEAHWFPEIVRAITPKQDNADITTAVATGNKTMQDIMEELANEFVKADSTSQAIRISLEADPSANAWLKTKMLEESSRQPYLPLEKIGVETAIEGALKLYTEITKPLEQTLSP